MNMSLCCMFSCKMISQILIYTMQLSRYAIMLNIKQVPIEFAIAMSKEEAAKNVLFLFKSCVRTRSCKNL